MIYKTLHSNTNPSKNRGLIQVLQKGKQFLLHKYHPLCYSFHKLTDKSWMIKGTEHVRGHLWHRYAVTVNPSLD